MEHLSTFLIVYFRNWDELVFFCFFSELKQQLRKTHLIPSLNSLGSGINHLIYKVTYIIKKLIL